MQTVFNFTDYSELTANTGIVNISTGNPNLDGTTGSYTKLLTGGANGTIINSLIIKATQTTTQGMIRFFVKASANLQLLQEVIVPACTPTAVQPAFETRVSCDINLAATTELWVSTENSESFNIIAEGLDWAYPASPACCDHMNRVANNGIGKVDTGNSHLDGTGAIVTIFTATLKGSAIDSVHIKAQQNTQEGMIRLFVNDGVSTFLLTEIPVPAARQTAIVPSTINQSVNYSLMLQNTYRIAASTENTEDFSVVIDGLSWRY